NLYDRQIAMFHADHGTQLADGRASALQAFEVRRDIYGADAVAWTAFRAGDIDGARAAMREALRLGTRDPRLFFHAGMIPPGAGRGRPGRWGLPGPRAGAEPALRPRAGGRGPRRARRHGVLRAAKAAHPLSPLESTRIDHPGGVK